jgi:gliding motility-associated-like protein
MKAVLRFILLVIILLIGNSHLLAQPAYNTCSSALELCPNNLVSINNINANKSFCVDCEDDFNFCFTANNTIWLKFKTNAVGGNVQLDFSNLVFENNPGQSQTLQASLINTVSPCTANAYTQLGNCVSNGTSNFALSASNLAVNTTFYVVISGDKSGVGITKAAECTFNVSLSGTAVDRIPPTIGIAASKYKICKNEAVQFLAVMKHCKDSSDFKWFINNELVAVTKDSTFSTSDLKTNDVVKVSNSCYTLCPITISDNSTAFTVDSVIVEAGEDVHISSGQSYQLMGVTAADSYFWSPNFALSSTVNIDPIASPAVTTTYTLTAKNNTNGCTSFDNVTVYVKEALTIPTTFSPNNDGINDVFEIVGIENYPNCFIQIFDRWGQEVFQKSGYSYTKAWNGLENGRELSSGTYFYSLELKDSAKQTFKGSITLIR